MSTASTIAPGNGVADAPADDFRVTGAAEIARWLAELRERAIPVILNAPDGTSYTSTLWSVDARAGHVSFSADAAHREPPRLVEADEAVAVAYLDSVKLQFDVPSLLFVRGSEGCALQAPYPRTLYRFQRRETFRVRTLEHGGPTLHLRHPSMPEMALALRILDVSVGGCSLHLPDDVPPLQPGTRLQSVHVDLDADTRFAAGLLLHHVASLPSGSGHRLGCEWWRVDAAAQRALQRYIDNTQKRRRQLALD